MPSLPPVHTVVVRVWLPDRPGALGQVASRIGSVKGDVLGIDILESGGGRVIDELVVALPDESVVDLMVSEVHAIDGVAVAHVRPTLDEHTDGDLFWSGLPAAGLWIAAGRNDRPVHDRERVRLDLFTRIADVLLIS